MNIALTLTSLIGEIFVAKSVSPWKNQENK